MGTIYLANQQFTRAQKLLTQALESSFELGPVISSEIERILL